MLKLEYLTIIFLIDQPLIQLKAYKVYNYNSYSVITFTQLLNTRKVSHFMQIVKLKKMLRFKNNY